MNIAKFVNCSFYFMTVFKYYKNGIIISFLWLFNGYWTTHALIGTQITWRGNWFQYDIYIFSTYLISIKGRCIFRTINILKKPKIRFFFITKYNTLWIINYIKRVINLFTLSLFLTNIVYTMYVIRHKSLLIIYVIWIIKKIELKIEIQHIMNYQLYKKGYANIWKCSIFWIFFPLYF
jgi:hypothetical protein